MKSFLDLETNEKVSFFKSNNFKSFNSNQIDEWIYKKSISSFDDMTNLSLLLREKLKEHFYLFSLKIKKVLKSRDNQTIKYLFELEDKSLIEAVLILSDKRVTICLSTQVGCVIGCKFCASGKKGFFRNLKSSEIIEQILLIKNEFKSDPTHIVFMGMGEPLLNFDGLIDSIKIISNDKFFGISQRRITVSTVGIIEGIEKLKDSGLKINLALSLHFPTDDLRNKFIPYSKKYNIKKLLDSLNSYFQKSKREITFEYILIENENDNLKHAKELYELLKNTRGSINLIPFNPIEGVNLKKPDNKRVNDFKSYLVSKGLNVTQRYTKGSDISASCGQLAFNSLPKLDHLN